MHPQIVEAGRQLTRAVCSKRATLLGNVASGRQKSRVRAELIKRLDVERPGIRARGDMIGIPLPNILD